MQHESFVLNESDWIPNNPVLPVLIYRAVVDDAGDTAAERFETLFEEHGWPPQWRDGVHAYHHYHSTAHEALGIVTGSARLMLGGPGGRIVDVQAGDALVLPVGTGHCSVEASDDFLVVGAYPKRQEWDICRDAPSDEARRRMRTLAVPEQDPVNGTGGALSQDWHR